MKKFFKIISIIPLVIIVIGGIVYFGFLRYPELKGNPNKINGTEFQLYLLGY